MTLLPRTIGLRLAALNGLVVFGALLGLLLLGLYAVERALVGNADRVIFDEMNEVENDLRAPDLKSEGAAAVVREMVGDERIYQLSFRLVTADDQPVVSTGPADWSAIPRLRELRTGRPRTVRLPGDEYRTRVAARAIQTPALGALELEVALRLRSEDETIERLVEGAAIALPIGLAIACAAGLFLARRALRPVDVLDRAARSIGGEQPGARLPRTESGDELDRLAATLNGMLGRLEAASARNLAFAGDVAHEVRTPLATMRARLEESLAAARTEQRAPLERALEELARLQSLVSSLLLLARADEGRAALPLVPLDLAPLAREVVEFFIPSAVERGIQLSIEAPETAPILGDAASLRRMLANLVDNALRFTPRDRAVRVLLETAPSVVAISVEDEGPGVDEPSRARLFERFFRAPATAGAEGTPGHGLGLAIVRAIARAHGGEASHAARIAGGSVFRAEIHPS